MTSSWKWPIVIECVREGLQVSVCTDLSPGLFAPNWTLSQHTDKDALWLIAFITFITCFTILISALYFTLPLSLTAGHWTLNISHRITIKLQIVWLPVASFSHEAPARSSFSVQNIRGRLKVLCFGKKQGFYNSSKHSHMFLFEGFFPVQRVWFSNKLRRNKTTTMYCLSIKNVTGHNTTSTRFLVWIKFFTLSAIISMFV